MSSINTSDVISVLKEEISDFDVKMTAVDEGSIISMGDGIVTVYGLSNAMYGELVIFETGVKGMVQGLEEQTVSCVLLGSDHGLHEGSKVRCSGRRAGVPAGSDFSNRQGLLTLSETGSDGQGEIKQDDFYPIRKPGAWSY